MKFFSESRDFEITHHANFVGNTASYGSEKNSRCFFNTVASTKKILRQLLANLFQ